MPLNKLVVFGLLSLATASPIESRSATAIEADITTIIGDSVILGNAVVGWLHGSIPIGGITDSVGTLTTDFCTAGSDATSTDPLSSLDSASVYSQVLTMANQVTTAMGAVCVAAPAIIANGYGPTVAGDLGTLRSEAGLLLGVLQEIVIDFNTMFNVLRATTDAAFVTAISACSAP